MIEGDIRREKIIEIMSNQKEPVSGSDLAKKFSVSRQVIVQDIALLRATNKNILSTNKGYFLYNPGKGPQKPKRSFCVQHTTEQMQDELYTIVDYGGKVLDAVVEHDIYGQITVDLMLCNRMDVDEFMERIRKSKSQPLNVLTGTQWRQTRNRCCRSSVRSCVRKDTFRNRKRNRKNSKVLK